MSVMLQMYSALKDEIKVEKELMIIFLQHIEAAFKLTRPAKKKTVMPKAFNWLEVLIKEAPPAFYKL